MKFDVIIIGGGAAGLMCAFLAGRRGRSVVLLEHNDRIGKKILISGGGRCNFTNLHAGPDNYLSRNPHFCKSALARYTPADFLALVEHHGIAHHEKKLGQLFCDFSSKQIVEMLERECRSAGVDIRVNGRVERVDQGPPPERRFRVSTNQGVWDGNSLVIATGGLSFPNLGATDFGHRLARQFGLNIIEPAPGLVPLLVAVDSSESWPFNTLSGISLDVIATANGHSFRENILFTHRGLSGPSVLQISNYCQPGDTVHLNLLPDQSPGELLQAQRTGGRDLPATLARQLPQRFLHEWCARYAPARPVSQWSNADVEKVARLLGAWPLRVAGTEGYAKAEVTRGGVDTAELSSQTMECRRVPGLYFIGEVVDVTGWLGGYNFQWAWASAHAAAGAV